MSLRDTIHAEIASGKYECVVCYDTITKTTPIWSCPSCYRCFDVKCAKEWWRKEAASQKSFRCPFCRSHLSKSIVHKASYRCWCRKEPAPSKRAKHSTPSLGDDVAVPPHSCGQTCGAKRKCPHPCPLVCHAGPHLDSADCMYLGPKTTCFCGKRSEKVVCSLTKYGGFSCDEKCGARNPVCGHKCAKKCHKRKPANGKSVEGCGPCEVSVQVSCFCGRSKPRTMRCHQIPKEIRNTVKGRRNKAVLSCGKACDALMSCGIHKCTKPCHTNSSPETDHVCPRLPYEGETCFCGKIEAHRSTCTDEVPSCGNTCAKMLSCGHLCEKVCHEGACPPCEKELSDVKCRCGNNSMTATCGQTKPVCDKKCGALLTCGRHHCAQLCCDFDPSKLRALQNHRPSPRPTSQTARNRRSRNEPGQLESSATPESDTTDRDFELALYVSGAEIKHACNRVCGRPLSCGTHFCQSPCHSGKCSPCRATSFDEWVCPCGRTTLEPPIVCGTPLPECRYPCHRSQPCGHRATHECHSDDTSCPSCSEIVTKPCRCGKHRLPARCDQNLVQCKERCGLRLDCGHQCTNICCPGGESCPPCTNVCGNIYKCGHGDSSKCHFPDPCSDCRALLTARCPCGALSTQYECGEDMELFCNQDCLLEAYPAELLQAYADDKGWMFSIEQQVRQFVKNEQKKSLWFQPMGSVHRRLVHLLLTHYGIASESMDYGKNRSVRAYRTKDTRLRRRPLRDPPTRTPKLSLPTINLSIFRREGFIKKDNSDVTEDDSADIDKGQDDVNIEGGDGNDRQAGEEVAKNGESLVSEPESTALPEVQAFKDQEEHLDGMTIVTSKGGNSQFDKNVETAQSRTPSMTYSFSLLASANQSS